MKELTFNEHLQELKTRLLVVVVMFTVVFGVCYYFSTDLYDLLLKPLAEAGGEHTRRMIYTGLAEVFFSYIKLAAFASFCIILPIIAIQLYLFISPGLCSYEKKLAIFILLMSPLLFWGASIFVFYYVMPRAWHFFISFENLQTVIPIVLEAKINEYLNLIIHLVVAFGIAFQLPIILLIFNLLKIVSVQTLVSKRRLAIVVNFVIAGIITPPDVLSQIALAIPMVLLYELSIVMCKFIENRGSNNARYQMD
jgi:sec-independent protein translocase protein TatC